MDRTASTSRGFVKRPTDRLGGAIDLEPISDFLDRILSECEPKQIWLFGSRARGDGSPWTDWDLLVVLPDDADERYFEPLFSWRLTNASGVRADVFFCRHREYIEDRGVVNTIMFDVANEGVLLYER